MCPIVAVQRLREGLVFAIVPGTAFRLGVSVATAEAAAWVGGIENLLAYIWKRTALPET